MGPLVITWLLGFGRDSETKLDDSAQRFTKRFPSTPEGIEDPGHASTLPSASSTRSFTLAVLP
jgi:hypothetical protein